MAPGKIVEIDEAKFGKRKYNCGRYRDGRCVIGGIERGIKKIFMEVVTARDAAILFPLIQRNVTAGSIIQTGEWATYVRLPTLEYVHQTVNHSTNFVDPTSGAFTWTIESSWAHVTSKYKRMHGTSKELFPTYLLNAFGGKSMDEAMFISSNTSTNNV